MWFKALDGTWYNLADAVEFVSGLNGNGPLYHVTALFRHKELPVELKTDIASQEQADDYLRSLLFREG